MAVGRAFEPEQVCLTRLVLILALIIQVMERWFSQTANNFSLSYIAKVIEEFKIKSLDFGFSERRALQQSYNTNIESELAEAYNTTRTLEKDLKQLVYLSEFLSDRAKDYEDTITEIKNERDVHASDISYLQEMYDQVKLRESQK